MVDRFLLDFSKKKVLELANGSGLVATAREVEAMFFAVAQRASADCARQSLSYFATGRLFSTTPGPGAPQGSLSASWLVATAPDAEKFEREKRQLREVINSQRNAFEQVQNERKRVAANIVAIGLHMDELREAI